MSAGDWSVPESAVLARTGEALGSGRDAVLATIVAVDGSAYRRPGAKMLVTADGEGVGSVTAGCIEDEVRSLAARVLETGEPRVERFDLMGDDDVWGLGVGCNGIIDILLEPVDDGLRPMLDAFEAGEDAAAWTVLDGEAVGLTTGDRRFVVDSAVPDADGWPDWLVADAAERAEALVADGKSDAIRVEHDGATVELFVDALTAPPQLVVCGTGHDVGPVVEVASKAGFQVTVAGFRGADATPDRFPAADEVVSTSPAKLRDGVDLDGDTYVVVMTHNFVDDRLALDELLQSPVPYVGLMGPEDRFTEMREAFAEEGREFTADELDRVYTPVGLALGGGEPYQIALSIVAEILAVHNDREPGHLSAGDDPIHARPTLGE